MIAFNQGVPSLVLPAVILLEVVAALVVAFYGAQVGLVLLYLLFTVLFPIPSVFIMIGVFIIVKLFVIPYLAEFQDEVVEIILYTLITLGITVFMPIMSFAIIIYNIIE